MFKKFLSRRFSYEQTFVGATQYWYNYDVLHLSSNIYSYEWEVLKNQIIYTWQHNEQNPGEDNGHSHLRGQLQGPSITIPFADGSLLLGTWQQIVVVDFDTRARRRDIIVQILGE